MQALRQIQIADSDSISIKIPRAFQRRELEIIVIPLDKKVAAHGAGSAWPKGFFEKTAGCFAAAPLVREDQGAYDVRNEIL